MLHAQRGHLLKLLSFASPLHRLRRVRSTLPGDAVWLDRG